MSKIQWLLSVSVIVWLLSVSLPARAAAPDSTLFTTYTISTGHTSLTWTVCGSTQQTEGCYGSGPLEPFGKIGALLESKASVNLATNTVTRLIYWISPPVALTPASPSLFIKRLM